MEIRTYKKGEQLGNLLGRYKFLEKVKVRKAVTLFDIEPDWKKVKEGKCGICGNKLTIPRSGKVAVCRGKRHPDKRPFIITIKKLIEIRK